MTPRKKSALKKYPKLITLTGKQIESICNGDTVEGFEFDADLTTGSYEISKASMVDYEFSIYNDNVYYEGVGGYYNEICGHCFDDDTYELTKI